MKTIARSKCGVGHAENQDHYCVAPNENGIVLGVADGIGSHTFGGSVAKWFCDNFSSFACDTTKPLVELLQDLRIKMVSEFDDFQDLLESGASISCAVVSNNTADCAWAGDSPMFHVSATTKSAKMLSPLHANANGALTNYFMGNFEFHPSSVQLELETGDLLIICSDGANLTVETATELLASADLENSIEQILEVALKSNLGDDATIVAYRHCE